jgi:hypothetical protein
MRLNCTDIKVLNREINVPVRTPHWVAHLITSLNLLKLSGAYNRLPLFRDPSSVPLRQSSWFPGTKHTSSYKLFRTISCWRNLTMSVHKSPLHMNTVKQSSPAFSSFWRYSELAFESPWMSDMQKIFTWDLDVTTVTCLKLSVSTLEETETPIADVKKYRIRSHEVPIQCI